MWWECSECGAQVERLRAPEVCAECGRASIIVRADEVGEGNAGWTSLWQLWTQRALARGTSGELLQSVEFEAQPAG
jgi:predicted amidophosphoribosyltransferase